MFLFAQTDTSALQSILPLVLLGAVFYFMMIRPQRRRQRAQQALLASLEVGDEVRTAGGIHGRIRSLDDNTAVVTVEDGSYIRFNRRSIIEKISREN